MPGVGEEAEGEPMVSETLISKESLNEPLKEGPQGQLQWPGSKPCEQEPDRWPGLSEPASGLRF